MRVAQIVAGIDDAAAGPSYTVSRLSHELTKLGVEVELHTPRPEPQTRSSGVRYRLYPRVDVMRGVMLCPTMRRNLIRAAGEVDVVHSQGFWLAPNFYACAAARRHGRPLVLSPHGMLSPWAMAHKAWKRAAARALGYVRSLEAVTCFHATSESEAEDIRRLGFRQPIAVVPNGIDLPDINDIGLSEQRSDGQRRALFLSRIHPVKGIPILLRAWRRIEAGYPDWQLTVAGPDEGGHLRSVRALATELGLRQVSFPGPVYGEEKTLLFRSADLFVLPTHSENFGLVVGEALAHAVPVITTTGAPWGGLIEHGCGWWIELSEDNLAAAMREAMALPSEKLASIGMLGRRWMAAEYGWDAVARSTAQVYAWLANKSEMPPCCRLF